MLFQEYIPLQIFMYLLSGGIFAAAVFVWFCRVPHRFPCGKFPLAFLAFVIGKDIRQQDFGNVLNLMLRDAAVVDELLSPAQVAPPKSILPQLSSRAAEERCLERLLSFCFSLHPSFLIRK